MNKGTQQPAGFPSYRESRPTEIRSLPPSNSDSEEAHASPVSNLISPSDEKSHHLRNDNLDDSPLKGYEHPSINKPELARKGRSLFQKKVDSMMLTSSQKHPQYFHKEKAIVLPDGILTEDNIMGCMFTSFANDLELEIYTYKGEAEFSRDFDEKFAIGLYFGATINQMCNLNRSKSGYELGKAHAYAQRVKKFFAKTPELGEEALIKDNFFFGNNPSEKSSKGQDVSFDLKNRFIGLFKSDQNAHHMYSVYLSCIGLYELNGFEDETIDKIIHTHIIKVDDMVRTTFRTEYSKKKGKTVLSAVKKPNLPARSPLFLQVEMNLLHKLLTPFWDSLTDLKRDYESRVFECGFSVLKKQITDLYQLRWGILSKFAKVTTKRLQAIRKMTGSDKLRKQEVVDAQLRALIDLRGMKARNLCDELAEIIPANGLIKAIGGLNKGSPSDDNQARLLLMGECAQGYLSVDINTSERYTPDRDILRLNDVEIAVNRLTHLRLKVGQLKAVASKSTSIKPVNLPGYAMNLRGQISNLDAYIAQTRQLSQEALEYAGRTMEPPLLQTAEYLHNISVVVEKTKVRIRQNLHDRQIFANDAQRQLFIDAQKNLTL